MGNVNMGAGTHKGVLRTSKSPRWTEIELDAQSEMPL